MAVENKRMLQLAGTPGDWASNPLTPLRGEICVEVNGAAQQMRIGDGVLPYTGLDVVSRRSDTEFNTAVNTIVDGRTVAVSAGAADDGAIPVLDATGVLDVSMMPADALVQGSVRFLGEADFTAAPPGITGGYQIGDVYFNSTTGVGFGGWGTSIETYPVWVGDMVVFDAAPFSNWRYIPGVVALAQLKDRDYADDTAAGTGGVPVGGMYHTAGAVKIRVT